MIDNIEWLGHDSFRIRSPDGKVIYIDPWQLSADAGPADVIFVTHDHYDHCSPEDIDQIRTDETVIVADASASKKLKGPVRTVKAGDRLTVRGIEVEVVPAYNIDKTFHPKEAGHVGYVITVGGQRIYHGGDTDVIPEMEAIQADIALLPVSGTYVMTVEEAVEAARKINPQWAVPMHCGTIVGSTADMERFQELAPVQVRVLPKVA